MFLLMLLFSLICLLRQTALTSNVNDPQRPLCVFERGSVEAGEGIQGM